MRNVRVTCDVCGTCRKTADTKDWTDGGDLDICDICANLLANWYANNYPLRTNCTRCGGKGIVTVTDDAATCASSSCGESRMQTRTERCEVCMPPWSKNK